MSSFKIMSIKIHNLTKFYGDHKAVNQISFEVREGEIVGFLGPNGAGKSTTMKIVTCFLSPSEGKVEVNGFDVVNDSAKVKKITGYLPEHNPLYQDLYIREYLQYVGKLYKLKGADLKRRVDEIINLTGLAKEQNKKIEELSKGYKQRVGLAQALIHDPDILVLDEPTTGLDPNQIVEVRNLIKSISKTKTVLLSTHIMQEVKAICDRVVIIHDGKIVADDTVNELQKRMSSMISTRIQLDEHIEPSLLLKIEGVDSVKELEDNTYLISSVNDVRKQLTKFTTDNDLNLLELRLLEDSLEDIFMSLTNPDK